MYISLNSSLSFIDIVLLLVFPLEIDFSTSTTTATANDDTPSFENQGTVLNKNVLGL